MWRKLYWFYEVGDFLLFVIAGLIARLFLWVIFLSLFKTIVTNDSWNCYLKPEPKYILSKLAVHSMKLNWCWVSVVLFSSCFKILNKYSALANGSYQKRKGCLVCLVCEKLEGGDVGWPNNTIGHLRFQKLSLSKKRLSTNPNLRTRILLKLRTFNSISTEVLTVSFISAPAGVLYSA